MINYLDVLSDKYKIPREKLDSRAAGLLAYFLEAEYDGAKTTVTYLKASTEGAVETSIRIPVTNILKGIDNV